MKILTLRQFYIAQLLAGTNAAFPARATGEEVTTENWSMKTAERILRTVDELLDSTGDDGEELIRID